MFETKQQHDVEIVRALARVAAENPAALRLAAQLLGVPACPLCDFVMRPGHVCADRRRDVRAAAQETKAE